MVDLKKLLLSNITVIVTGDFNFDRRESNALTCFLGAKMLQQIVKWPTHNKGRTIEHIYVSKNLFDQIGAGGSAPWAVSLQKLGPFPAIRRI